MEAELFTGSEGRGQHGWEFYTGDEFFPERTHQKRDDLSSECTPGCSNLRTTAGVVQADLTETDAPGTSEVAAPRRGALRRTKFSAPSNFTSFV